MQIRLRVFLPINSWMEAWKGALHRKNQKRGEKKQTIRKKKKGEQPFLFYGARECIHKKPVQDKRNRMTVGERICWISCPRCSRDAGAN